MKLSENVGKVSMFLTTGINILKTSGRVTLHEINMGIAAFVCLYREALISAGSADLADFNEVLGQSGSDFMKDNGCDKPGCEVCKSAVAEMDKNVN